MNNNIEPILEYMAVIILEDSKKLGTFWCIGCGDNFNCNYSHPRYCVIDFCKERVDNVEKRKTK